MMVKDIVAPLRGLYTNVSSTLSGSIVLSLMSPESTFIYHFYKIKPQTWLPQ